MVVLYPKFKLWKSSIKALPWQKKWFIYLILLRPIIDTFYFLKELSPFLSPLYFVGVLTPILIFFSLITHRQKVRVKSLSLRIWSAFLFVNCIILVFTYPDFDMIGEVIKYTIPIFLFYYIWQYFRTLHDIELILYAGLIASIFPISLLLFEYFVTPIKVVTLTESRGGGERYEGLYADSVSYAIYLVTMLISFSYFFLKRKYGLENNNFTGSKFIFVLFIIIIGMISIKHTATWGVVLAIFSLLILSNLRDTKGFVILFIITLIFFPLFGQYLLEDQIIPLIQKELNVLQGYAPMEASFNGRMTRWLLLYENWEKMSISAKFFGVVYSNNEFSRVMVTGFTHNDYIRQIFLSGIIGFIAYIILLTGSIKGGLIKDNSRMFLILSAAITIILYSVSSMPTLYANLLYILIPIITYSLTKKI